MTKKFYKKPLSISQQKEGMKRWPCFCAQPSKNDNSISWQGQIQPLDDANTYIVEIRYALQFHPYVSVLHPKIKPSAPHLNRNGSLCLYHPYDCDGRIGSYPASHYTSFTFKVPAFGNFDLWCK